MNKITIKSNFTNPILVYIEPSYKYPFILVNDIVYGIGTKESDEKVVVEAGFRTDFASIPIGVRNIFNNIDDTIKAALLHDKLYSTKIYSRKKTDDIFLEAMTVCNVNFLKKMIFYWSVRVFGYWSWKHNANK